MKNVMIGGVALVALVASAFVLAPATGAQQPGRPAQISPPPFLPLEGPGSSIGVSVLDQTAGDAGGVLINEVVEGTPAMRAGLQKGDIVVEFDGERTRSARQFTRLVRETPPGRAVKLTVVRAGSRRTVEITPESRGNASLERFPQITGELERSLRAIPRDFNFSFDTEPFDIEAFFASPRRLGVMVSPLSDQLATYFGVKQGVLVSEVTSGSPAAAAGIKAGDVLTAVNGHALESAFELTREVREAQPGASIELRVMRDHKELTVKVTVPERRPAAAGTVPI